MSEPKPRNARRLARQTGGGSGQEGLAGCRAHGECPRPKDQRQEAQRGGCRRKAGGSERRGVGGAAEVKSQPMEGRDGKLTELLDTG